MKLYIGLAAALGFLGIGIHPAIAADTLRLGFLSSLSGPIAALGAEQRRGINLALEELGGKQGFRCSLRKRNSAANPASLPPINTTRSC